MWGNTNDGQAYNTFFPLYSYIKSGLHYFNHTAMPGYTPYTYRTRSYQADRRVRVRIPARR